MILYAGLGIIYGSYVGLTGRAADMQFVSAKMARLLFSSGALQVPLAGVVWILYTRQQVSVGARIFRTAATVLATQMVAVGTMFVLYNSEPPPS